METDQNGLVITRHLQVKLSDGRRLALGCDLAEQHYEEQKQATYLANIKKSIQTKINEAQAKQHIAAEALHQGFEMKEVPCRQVIDLDTNTVTIYRDDTGEKVESRAMEPKEREQLKKRTTMPPVTPSSKLSTKEASHGS